MKTPTARSHHAAAVFGSAMIVHGGYCGEENKILDDWHLFDFGLQVWIQCTVQDVQIVSNR